MTNSIEVTIKRTHIVKPLEPTYNGVIQLPEWNQIGVITHVPTVYFYKPSQEWVASSRSIIDTLKDSMSRMLVHFYPLAGRLHSIGGGRLELHCNAMGVEFIEAESSAKLSDFGDFVSHTSLFKDLFPSIDYTKPIEELPIVLGQVTKFKCGGISLGMANSHVIVDGQTAAHFLSEWARLARGEPLKLAPFFDPQIFETQYLSKTQTNSKSNTFSNTEFKSPPLLIGQQNNSKELEKPTKISVLHLSKDLVETLKKEANKYAKCNIKRPYTRYEVVTSHIWKCACKARKHLAEQETCLSLPLDVRNRVHPPLPPKYLGNAIIDLGVSSKSGEIIANPLSYVCAKIRGALEKVNHDYVLSNMEYWRNMDDLTPFQDLHAVKRKEGPFYGNPNLGVISWLTLPLHGLDFGWGGDIYMGPGTHDSDGDCMLLPGPVNDGSVKVAICLQVAHMDAFKKYFYEDISCEA